jgi:phosphohistidine phosphatase
MKMLYLVRHAKSDWENQDQKDFDRSLNDRGRKEAPEMASKLKERGIIVDLLLSSPALRTLSTSKLFAEILGYPENEIKTERRLYNAEPNTMLSIIQKTSDDIQSLMIIGHNPGVTELVNSLLGTILESMPTCGIVAGKLNIQSWQDLDWGGGKIEFSLNP